MLDRNTSLSIAQKRIWFDCQTEGLTRNHLALVYELRGNFSKRLMQQALTQLVAENQRLERIVHETIKADLKTIRLDSTMENGEMYRTINTLIEKPFNLSAGPLFRFTPFEKSTEEHYLVLVFHRMVVNFCSF